MRGVKIIYRLQQTDAAYLEQVIRVFAAVFEALQHTEHQAQVTADYFLSGRSVPGTRQAEELFHSAAGQNGQLIGIDTANIYLFAVQFLPLTFLPGIIAIFFIF
jgi:hypothetical protein